MPGCGSAVARSSGSAELAHLADRAPGARMELDQSHCTVETKVRRVLAFADAGALEGKRILLLGDDDLTSVAIRLVTEELGLAGRSPRPSRRRRRHAGRSFLRRALRGAPFEVDVLVHDLRKPLPERLRGTADAVFTDPPYTADGATLFLSRAAEATVGPPGRDVFLAFGPKRPDELLRMQRAIASMGFVVRAAAPQLQRVRRRGRPRRDEPSVPTRDHERAAAAGRGPLRGAALHPRLPRAGACVPLPRLRSRSGSAAAAPGRLPQRSGVPGARAAAGHRSRPWRAPRTQIVSRDARRRSAVHGDRFRIATWTLTSSGWSRRRPSSRAGRRHPQLPS